jgi:glycosyltransferase involved in cell wall biosynthesis
VDVRIFAGHDGSGCAWYRIILPLQQLEAHGHEVTLACADQSRGRGSGSDITIEKTAGYDVVVAQRWDAYHGMGTWRRMAAHSRLVYEVDDDVWSVEPTNWASYQRYSQADAQEAVSHQAAVANLVTVTTGPLAAVMREHNPNVQILPNHIPAWVCGHVRPRRDRPVVGWMGGASHGRDMGEIAAPLRQFIRRFPGWDAHMIGVDYRPTLRLPAGRVQFSPWVHVVDEPEQFYGSIDFDIGVAPLAPSAFARSKSYLKALEYGALGIPVIATDAEPYTDFILHGVTGFLVRRPHEWGKYLSELAADAGLRETMGAKAREHARNYTIETGWKLWEDAYRRLLR